MDPLNSISIPVMLGIDLSLSLMYCFFAHANIRGGCMGNKSAHQ